MSLSIQWCLYRDLTGISEEIEAATTVTDQTRDQSDDRSAIGLSEWQKRVLHVQSFCNSFSLLKSVPFLGDAYGHTLFISRRRVYFPKGRINWIKEELSDDGKDFRIPWDLLKPVSIKLKERYGKLYNI